MIQIIRANVITTTGTIVLDYRSAENKPGGYPVTDLEAERRLIRACMIGRGYEVKRINITYITEE